MSSKKWLSQNGLSAKKLTIIDLLAPTFISHEPKYVPAINRKALSKVFDEVRALCYTVAVSMSSFRSSDVTSVCLYLSVRLSLCMSVCLQWRSQKFSLGGGAGIFGLLLMISLI